MRTRDGSDAVEGVGHVGDPVAQGLVHGVLQGARAGLDRHHLGAQHVHAKDVGLLPLDVDRAHIDDAFKPVAGAEGGGGNAVLSGAGLGDDPLLAHAAGKKDLAQHVVHLVGAGVIELLALEVDLRPVEVLGQALGEIERAWTTDVMGHHGAHLGVELRIGLGVRVGLLEIEHERHQGFGHEAAAENAEMTALVGAGAEGIGLSLSCHADPALS